MAQVFHHIPILSYHKITPQKEFGINTVTPARFRQQMQYLREKKFQSVTFQDIIHGHLPPKPILITFDDGYACVYDHALPILKSINFRAVIFNHNRLSGQKNSWDASFVQQLHFRT